MLHLNYLAEVFCRKECVVNAMTKLKLLQLVFYSRIVGFLLVMVVTKFFAIYSFIYKSGFF